MTHIKIRALSPFRAVGEDFAAGAVVSLPALDAAMVMWAGRGELANPADAAALKASVDEYNRKAVAKEKRAIADPWRPQ